MPLAVVLGVLQMFLIEYFVLLEIIRPFIIWFTLRSQQEEQEDCPLKTVLYWLPFAAWTCALVVVAASLHPYAGTNRSEFSRPSKNHPAHRH